MLRQLSGWCKPTSSKGQRLQQGPRPTPLSPVAAATLWASHGHSLVWARFSLFAKGRPELHAMVCVPTDEDLQLLSRDPRCTGPQEPRHVDHFRKRVKSACKGKKKKTKKKGKRNEGKAEGASEERLAGSGGAAEKMDVTSDPNPRPAENPSTVPAPTPNQEVACTPGGTPDGTLSLAPALPQDPSTSDPPVVPVPTSAAAEETEKLILGMWPDPLPSVTSHCSRVTLGWVTQGDFSLAAGCGEALGLVSLVGVLHTLLHQPPEHRGLLLLRNPSSLQYRFAKVTIEA